MIRSTGQSLLDYVPEGATREGFAGTYATQENFRLMRAALDESSKELGRYVRLTNYASGLCMPEIATLAGLERLDMMLNDSMYGILFRDINPIRTFVDQRFSRQIHARAGIIINTGEDNYLTTADAVEAAHTVTVSQLLNEYFAHEAGLADWQLGLGHAFEINPDLPESFRLELAHALLARELFPDAPLKWMPPTKHMTGDVFRGNLLDGFFNLVGALTGQGILLVGMMTEAVVTPWLSDRDIALQNVRYVLSAAGGLHEDFVPAPGGFIQQRAHQVLGEAVDAAGADRRRHAAQRDRRRHVRHHEAARRPGQGPRRRGRARATATTTRPPRSWRPTSERRERRQTIVRPYGDTTGDGMVQVSVHAADPARQAGRGRRAAAGGEDGPGPGDGGARQADGRRRSRSSSSTAGCSHLVDLAKVQVVERDFPLLRAKEVNTVDQAAAAAQAGRGRRVHRHRRAHGRHRRDPQRQGHRRGEGPGVLPGAAGGEPGRAGQRAGAGRARPGRRRPTRCWCQPGGDPARRAPAQHPGDVGGVPGGVPGRAAGRCWSSAGRASTS